MSTLPIWKKSSPSKIMPFVLNQKGQRGGRENSIRHGLIKWLSAVERSGSGPGNPGPAQVHYYKRAIYRISALVLLTDQLGLPTLVPVDEGSIPGHDKRSSCTQLQLDAVDLDGSSRIV